MSIQSPCLRQDHGSFSAHIFMSVRFTYSDIYDRLILLVRWLVLDM
jgi:hypothetical protein